MVAPAEQTGHPASVGEIVSLPYISGTQYLGWRAAAGCRRAPCRGQGRRTVPGKGCAEARPSPAQEDASRSILETKEETVREALESEGVTHGALDRTQPPLWEPSTDGMTIIGTRGGE